VSSTIFDGVRDLLPEVSRRADEIEKLRTLPDDLVADLTAAGCFRMLVPRGYGGEELSVAQSLDLIEELSRADASTGWVVMIAVSNLMVLGLLPAATFEAVYADGPDVILGGSHAPKGTAVPVEGGYRVSGQWPFASGCQHAAWLVGHAAVVRDGERQLMANGMPVMRLAMMPAAEVETIDTWHTVGLRGTGSHDIRVSDVFCPEERTCQLFGAVPTIAAPIFSIPPVAPLALFIAAVAVGAAQGAIDDLVAVVAGGKRPAYGARRVAESPLVQARLGEADAELRAARALIHDEADRAWSKALASQEFSLLDRARMRTASSHAVTVATTVADTAYRLAGSSSLYDGSTLQRRMRDIHAITQHAGVGPDFFALAGALLVGEEIDSMRI
jgi:alkylation response protein AidB-like acyl-CoA dehydrogenase